MKLQVIKKSNKLYSEEIPFSTTETRIGVWTDGKPLYRKTLNIPAIATGGTGTIDLSSLKIESFFINFNKSYYKTGTTWLPLVRTHTTAVNSQIETRFNFSNNKVEFRCGSGVGIDNGIITVEYTKTTD